MEAKISVKYAHQMIREIHRLCEFYADKIERTRRERKKKLMLVGDERDPLSESISLLEISSLKLIPILEEILRRMVIEDPPLTKGSKGTTPKTGGSKQGTIYNSYATYHPSGNQGHSHSPSPMINLPSSSPSAHSSRKPHSTAGSSTSKRSNPKLDMRSIFGFLNNSDWVFNLNIGNIMQISPLTLQEIMSQVNKELELSRESVLDKIALLSVSYFCISTEKRFLFQDKPLTLNGEKPRNVESYSPI